MKETKSWHTFGNFPTFPTLCSKEYQCRWMFVPDGAEGDGLMARLEIGASHPTSRPPIHAPRGRYWSITPLDTWNARNSGDLESTQKRLAVPSEAADDYSAPSACADARPSRGWSDHRRSDLVVGQSEGENQAALSGLCCCCC